MAEQDGRRKGAKNPKPKKSPAKKPNNSKRKGKPASSRGRGRGKAGRGGQGRGNGRGNGPGKAGAEVAVREGVKTSLTPGLKNQPSRLPRRNRRVSLQGDP